MASITLALIESCGALLLRVFQHTRLETMLPSRKCHCVPRDQIVITGLCACLRDHLIASLSLRLVSVRVCLHFACVELRVGGRAARAIAHSRRHLGWPKASRKRRLSFGERARMNPLICKNQFGICDIGRAARSDFYGGSRTGRLAPISSIEEVRTIWISVKLSPKRWRRHWTSSSACSRVRAPASDQSG